MSDLDTSPRSGLDPRLRTAIWVVLVVVAVGGLFLTGRAAVTGGENTSQALPDYVDRLIPESGSEVLSQSAIGIDLATGYDAYLIVNGVEIRTEQQGLTRDEGLGIVRFQPGPDTEVEGLQPERNCVVAMVWPRSEGPDAAEPVSWCFTAA